MKRSLACLILILMFLPATGWAQRVNQLPGASGSPFAHGMSPAPAMSPTPAPAPSPAPLSGGLGADIAAVVNDNIITTADINDRIRLVQISAGLPDTPEVRQRLLLQILRGLVDEQLQTQEAKRLDINVTKEEIDQAMAHIAQENHIDGDLRAFVTAHGGSPDALMQQIKASIAWGKVVQRELRPNVEVGDDEVDATIERMRANAGKEEYAVSEILLTIDNPKDEDQVKQFADNLVQQLKGGANFAAIARQFSQGTGAANGGDIGWVQEGQMPSELDHALTNMQPGGIEGPIRMANGYHIIGLRDKRTISLGGNNGNADVKLNLQQVFHPYMSPADKDMVDQEAAQVRMAITSCNNIQGTLADKFPNWRWNNLGDVELSKAPPFIAEKVRDLSVGQGSDPISTDKGALIVYVCDRHVPDSNVDRNAIVNTIGLEKLELQARRLLRDLRRSAYIDIRLTSAPS